MQSYFHFSAIPLNLILDQGRLQNAGNHSYILAVTNKVKKVLLSTEQRPYYAEPITLNVLKSDMTKIIQQ